MIILSVDNRVDKKTCKLVQTVLLQPEKKSPTGDRIALIGKTRLAVERQCALNVLGKA